MTAPVRSLFIYWKLPNVVAADALNAVRQWQAALRSAHPGLQTRLYRRVDSQAAAEGLITVMESYAAPGGLGAALQELIDRAGRAVLRPFGAPQRHLELFEVAED